MLFDSKVRVQKKKNVYYFHSIITLEIRCYVHRTVILCVLVNIHCIYRYNTFIFVQFVLENSELRAYNAYKTKLLIFLFCNLSRLVSDPTDFRGGTR